MCTPAPAPLVVVVVRVQHLDERPAARGAGRVALVQELRRRVEARAAVVAPRALVLALGSGSGSGRRRLLRGERRRRLRVVHRARFDEGRSIQANVGVEFKGVRWS
jgi:hypothetical protein